ncbi:hypothetical protein SAY86_011544 [Trapa natans]|uniref:Membrane-associated kinase regulator 5 n=1 Tax=Trapa natans TaxID=22666 RepID=A0AAN7R580_TRANT|nr:hypothetical protein SAY86_011544 [Trapa natans]
MEALNFLKFWRPATSVSPDIHIQTLLDIELDEDDDSFFELELSLPGLGAKNVSGKNNNSSSKVVLVKRRSSRDPSLSPSPSTGGVFSRRKVIQIEAGPATSRPQSPLPLFKYSPKLSGSLFRKSKSTPNPKTGEAGLPVYLNMPKTSSLISGRMDRNLLDGSVSRRFSKEGMQRYLKFVNPFSTKGSEREVEELKLLSGNLLTASPLSSPATERKYAGKSRMAQANSVVSSRVRNDDSWAQQHDGIEGAILHCKKSFHSSRDCSEVSRSPVDPLQSEHKTPATS